MNADSLPFDPAYTRELVALARQQQLPEVPPHGLLRPDELLCLARCQQIALLGPSGVGKSALVMSYAQSLAAQSAPEGSPHLIELSFAGLRRILRPKQALQKLLKWSRISGHSKSYNGIFVPDLRLGLHPDWRPFLLELLSSPFHIILELDAITWKELEPLCREHRIPIEILSLHERTDARSSMRQQAWAQAQPDFASISIDALSLCQLVSERFGLEGGPPGGGIRLFRRCMLAYDVSAPAPSYAWLLERTGRIYGLPESAGLMPILGALISRQSSSLSAPMLTGQSHVKRSIERLFRQMQLRREGTEATLGSLLLSGAAGYGRRRLVRALARSLFGDESRVIDWGEPLRPFHVLLVPSLDSMEAAQRQLLTSILYGSNASQMLASAPTLDADARRIYRSIFIVCMHQGASTEYLPYCVGEVDAGTYEKVDTAVMERLGEEYKSALMQGFDAVTFFHPASREELRVISRELVQKCLERMVSRPRSVEVGETVYDWLAIYGVDPFEGIQLLERFVERSMLEAWSRFAEAEPSRNVSLRLTVQEQRLEFKCVVPDVTEGTVVSLPRAANPELRAAATPSAGPRAVEGRGIDVRSIELPSAQSSPSPQLLQVERLLKAAARRLKPQEAQEGERQRLLTRLREKSTWHDRAEIRRLYAAFQLLERQRLSAARLTESVKALRGQLSLPQDRTHSDPALEACMVDLSAAIGLWDERLENDGASQVWLVLSCLELQAGSGQWLTELLAMYKAWGAKRNLHVEVVGVELSREGLSRLALRLRGVGSGRLMGMEEGLHRLHRPSGEGLTVRVQCVPLDETGGAPSSGKSPQPLPARSVQMPVKFETEGEPELHSDGSPRYFRMRLELPARRQMFDFVGGSPALLQRMVTDLERAWAEPDTTPELARLYGSPKAGAWDPRTGAMVLRLMDALAGQLEGLWDQWLRSGG